ncbi:MAG: hypothetical protein IM631_12045 [Cytophagales bacterium]|nr:hypothetical protein [Cytophagales bacterium]MCA6372106.1 hypothetical protein [Cytophagales bacterium]MCA6382250.1 hypothetical protein [Cytophagales bacterium]
MLATIKPARLKKLFTGISTPLNGTDVRLLRWLSIFNAMVNINDLSMPGVAIRKSNPGHRVNVDLLGTFHIVLKEGKVSILSFSKD